MAINPPSDIVLDVARAADPAKYSAAVEKLVRLGESALDPEAADFAALLGEAGPGETHSVAAMPDLSQADLRSRFTPGSAPSSASAPAYQQFEAFVLQSFIQSMLPQEANSVFGTGLAGDLWRSMLAEQIAGEIAAVGGIGIAAQIASRHPAAAGSGAPPASSAYTTLPGLIASLELDFAGSVRAPDENAGEASAVQEG